MAYSLVNKLLSGVEPKGAIMAEVKLFKRNGVYQDKEGKEKKYTNFYVQCGDQLISVTPTYFENAEGRDPAYAGRKMVLSSYAEELPEKDS